MTVKFFSYFHIKMLSTKLDDGNTIRSYIVESLAAGISAQAATFPIIFSKIGTVQLLSFIPSTIVGWLVPLLINGTVVSVALSALLSCCSIAKPLTQLTGSLLLWIPADLFLHTLQYLSRYSWGVVSNPWLEQ
jgi:hypothetical protein